MAGEYCRSEPEHPNTRTPGHPNTPVARLASRIPHPASRLPPLPVAFVAGLDALEHLLKARPVDPVQVGEDRLAVVQVDALVRVQQERNLRVAGDGDQDPVLVRS